MSCHDSLISQKPHVHPPASENCMRCHAVQVTPAGSRIVVVDSQPALCVRCHKGLETAAAGKLAASHAPVADSCLTCHDPHATDVASLLKAPAVEQCLGCHDLAALQAAHGQQLTRSTSCTRCHAPHGSAVPKMLLGTVRHAPFADKSCDVCHRPPLGGRVRLQARADLLCTSCHGNIPAAAPAGGSWHPALRTVRGQRSGCLSCHDPHLGTQPKLLVTTGVALCASCHGAIATAAAGKNGHAPARDDCLSCHDAHSSARPGLLTDEPRRLCAGCHDPADAALRKAHLGAKLDALDCLACHTPHGAGNPKALARYLHAPVADGCDTCHQGSAAKLGEGGGPALCLTCHDGVGEQVKAAKVKHAAMDAARCVDCHNPHASNQQRLVKLPGGGACLACHSEQAAGQGETAHGAIAAVGCQACHEPHGSSRAKLLRAEGNELCLTCHRQPATPLPAEGTVQLAGRFDVSAADARAIRPVLLTPDGRRGHPLPNHPVAPVPASGRARVADITFKGQLACVTCHDPHKGRSALLLRWDAASAAEACLHCHMK